MKKTVIILAAVFACFSCTSIDMATRYPNMVADLDPFSVGTASTSFDMLFSSKRMLQNIDVIFYPRENTVVLEFRHELIRYRQFWDQAARQRFIEALAQYKDDFDNKRLINKYNKTRAAYGRFKGQVEWETFKYTSTYKASPTYELGYRFKNVDVRVARKYTATDEAGNEAYQNKAQPAEVKEAPTSRVVQPFFTVLQRSAKEETGIMSGSNLESKQFGMYYTRAQGDKLAELFNQNFLLEMAGVYVDGKPVVSDEDEVEVDEYQAD